MLLTGCATSSVRTTQKVQGASQPKITFVKKDPRSLDELMSATKSYGQTFQYTEKLDVIKEKIEKNPEYDAKTDLRSLVWDVQHSSLDNRLQLADSFKDFSYFKDYETIETRTRKPGQVGGMGAYTVGSYTFLIYLLARYGSMDEKQGQLGQATEEAFYVGLSSGLLIYIWDKMGSKKQKVQRRRTHVLPYYGTEKPVR